MLAARRSSASSHRREVVRRRGAKYGIEAPRSWAVDGAKRDSYALSIAYRPAPAAARYKKTKQYKTVSSP